MKEIKTIIAGFILLYLRFFARLQLKKINPVIIGVGGASGKTSLSNFIYLVLSEKFKVKQSKGKNSETGIPLDILDLQIKNYLKRDWIRVLIQAPLRVFLDFRKFDIYIAEMGIDSPLEPKNMSYLLKIIKPNIGVLTNISHEHSQYFDPLVDNENQRIRQKNILELTASQNGLLLTTLDKDGYALLNLDDPNIVNLKKDIKSKIITVSVLDKKADIFIEKIKNYVDKFEMSFIRSGKNYKIKINNPLPSHFAYSFVFAIGIAQIKGIEIEDSIRSLEEKFSMPPGRMTVFNGKKNSILIDSSYNNATLSPILDLLDFVYDIGKQRRRVGIIGDMRELGTMSQIIHEEVAQKILKTLDFAILIGPMTQKYIEPILRKNNFKCFSFTYFTNAKQTILDNLMPKDIVLIKGSQNTLFLERAVELLLENPKDASRLCRRGDFWDRIRAKTL